MDLGLKGKVVVVPAASQGLGRAVALAFAREGARVAMCSRNADAVQQVAEMISESGGDALAVAADVTQAAEIEHFIQTVTRAYGGIDVLVTNAGGPPAGTFDRFGDADWQAAFELTLLSAVRLIRAALPALRASASASIVAMTSSSVKQPIPNLLLSNVMRAGVAGLAKTLAEELAADRIRVNVIVPGRIATGRVAELDQANAARAGVEVAEIRERMTRQIPAQRYGDPEEFADAVVFLASQRASYITGATLQVDGGMIRALW